MELLDDPQRFGGKLVFDMCPCYWCEAAFDNSLQKFVTNMAVLLVERVNDVYDLAPHIHNRTHPVRVSNVNRNKDVF